MDLLENLIEFQNKYKDDLLKYDEIVSRMTKFSFSSPFYLHRKLIPQYVNQDNFLFGFDFGVCILKDKLIFLTDKLWIYQDFKFVNNISISKQEKKIKRENNQVKIDNINTLNVFENLLNILNGGSIENLEIESDPIIDIKKYINKKDSFLLELIDLIQNNQLLESVKTYKLHKNFSLKESHDYILKLKDDLPKIKEKWEQEDEEERLEIERRRIEEENRIIELNKNQDKVILSLDEDNDGKVDLVDGESYNKILNKNQKSIIDVDKSYIQKFVKISNYLKTKKSNTQEIFETIKDTQNQIELNELVSLLKNQIHTYELLVFHSITMVTSLVEGDLITFYEIYECFDQLGVFNSNWEIEVSNRLTNIGEGIKDLMYSIYQMESKIVDSIENLSYITQDSFHDLSVSVEKQLSSIDSSIKFNNLLTGIQTYQMYKINQNTKRIG
jgi:hypothetical protein